LDNEVEPRGFKVSDILDKAVSSGCSDIHVKPGSPPKMRKHGVLVPIPGYEGVVLSPRETDLLTFETMDSYNRGSFVDKKYDHDYSFELYGVGRFRMNAYKTRTHTAFVARLIEDKPKSLKELGVPEIISTLANYKSGVIIVTGATGSGKTTTMAGIIKLINSTKEVNIISVEDPIEILHSDEKSSVSQREIGIDVESFDSALTSALREDPDIILVGEIRHMETMKTVLRAADTGHLVVTTLHTTDTTEAINRIISMFPPSERDEQRRALSSVLRGIVGQRLVPKISGGRIPVNEVLINTPEMADAILDRESSAKDLKVIVEKSKNKGMQTFEQALAEMVDNKIISLKNAIEFSGNSDFSEYYEDRKNGKTVAPTTAPTLAKPTLPKPAVTPTVTPVVHPQPGLVPTRPHMPTPVQPVVKTLPAERPTYQEPSTKRPTRPTPGSAKRKTNPFG
jgi:twitching motility protein PilT